MSSDDMEANGFEPFWARVYPLAGSFYFCFGISSLHPHYGAGSAVGAVSNVLSSSGKRILPFMMSRISPIPI